VHSLREREIQTGLLAAKADGSHIDAPFPSIAGPAFRGYTGREAAVTIRHMNRSTYVFGWDEEPADERPSEFAPTTGYSAFSGYHHSSDMNRRVARRHQRGAGFGRFVFVCATLLGAAGYAIYLYAKVVHS
jgi:hypothetical protein